MQKLGAVAVTGAVLALALAAWTRQPSPPAQGGGTISGKMKFTGTKPAMPKIDMTEEPKCKAKYQGVPTEETVVVNPNGTLANVFVYVKSGLPASYQAPAPTGPVTLDQDGCRYHPHVLGILVGQPLAIKNSDGTTKTFDKSEIMVALECNVHGWMHAWLGVLPHPFFSVSGADGSFTLKGLPPGTYTIEAWHEKYLTQTATVTVAGSETKTADFSFAGK